MKILVTVLISYLVFFLAIADAEAGGKCESSEYMVQSVPPVKPSWLNEFRFADGGKEYFVGFSSQNTRLETGIAMAIENANAAVVEAAGQVMQAKNEILLTMTVDDFRKGLGSREATTYFRHKKREAIYYEKWASSTSCRTAYYYNVWVLVSVPSNELEREANKAALFLLNLQERENSGTGGGLMPDTKALHISEAPSSDMSLLPAQMTPEGEFEAESSFKCGNIGLTGGIDFPLGQTETNRGKLDRWGFNIFFDGDFSITRNICGGLGIGYVTLRMNNGGTGSIIPFPFKVTAKLPMGDNNGLIFWFGGEVGPAILYGFSNKTGIDKWTGETSLKKKVEGGFWAAGMAGIDIRVQKGLYLSIGGAYVPIVSGKTYQFIMGRAGIRFYF